MYTSLFGVSCLASLAFQTAYALPTISVKGTKFFANGQQFFLKGVAYQGTPSDPLVDTQQCQFDAASMKFIGTNSIRVYHVDPYANHDGCMSAFGNAGIYIWLDLDTFNSTVVQTAPRWTEPQFLDFARVMDVFQHYDNLGGFWIGNEVINLANGSPSAPYVKAAVADMKAYMAAKNYRQIPIGYSAADIAELRPMLQNYLACGSDPSQAIDFYGLNSYEWCGDATYQTSGYSGLQAMAKGYSIPLFFSETGCNVAGERTFKDQIAIFGPDMIDTWSGSIIYEWVQETNHYGIVTYPNGKIYSGAPVPIQPDFNNLQNVWKNINPSGVTEGSYSPSLNAPACPLASSGWSVNGNVPLPTLGASVVKAAANQLIATTNVAPTTYHTKATQTAAQTTSNPTISGMESSTSSTSQRSTSSDSVIAVSSTSEVSGSTTGQSPPSQTSQSSQSSSTNTLPASSTLKAASKTTSTAPTANTSQSAAQRAYISLIYPFHTTELFESYFMEFYMISFFVVIGSGILLFL